MKWRRLNSRRARWRKVTRLMARDGEACTICGAPLDRHNRDPESANYVTFDHITPRSRGGLDVLSNLRLAHRSCNLARGNDPIAPEEESDGTD